MLYKKITVAIFGTTVPIIFTLQGICIESWRWRRTFPEQASGRASASEADGSAGLRGRNSYTGSAARGALGRGLRALRGVDPQVGGGVWRGRPPRQRQVLGLGLLGPLVPAPVGRRCCGRTRRVRFATCAGAAV